MKTTPFILEISSFEYFVGNSSDGHLSEYLPTASCSEAALFGKSKTVLTTSETSNTPTFKFPILTIYYNFELDFKQRYVLLIQMARHSMPLKMLLHLKFRIHSFKKLSNKGIIKSKFYGNNILYYFCSIQFSLIQFNIKFMVHYNISNFIVFY